MAFVPNVNWVNDEPPGFEADEMIRMQLGIADAASVAGTAESTADQALADAATALQKANAVDGMATPALFGAVGDGVTDDTAALLAAIQSGRPLDWRGLTYRISAALPVTLGTDLMWFASGARIVLDSPSTVHRTVSIDTAGHDVTIYGPLAIDAQRNAHIGWYFTSTSSTASTFAAYGLRAENIHRATTALTGGDGIWIRGNYSSILLVAPHVQNVTMAEGAGVTGSQGVAGITISAAGADLAPDEITILHPYISDVYSEDAAYLMDQDGIRIFTEEDTGSVIPFDTHFRIAGGKIRQCGGRGIKSQAEWGVVDGTMFVRYGSGVMSRRGAMPEIDFQVGGGIVTNTAHRYTSSSPNRVIHWSGTRQAGGKYTAGLSVSNVHLMFSGSSSAQLLKFMSANMQEQGRASLNLTNVELINYANQLTEPFMTVTGSSTGQEVLVRMDNITAPIAPGVAMLWRNGSTAVPVFGSLRNVVNTRSSNAAFSGSDVTGDFTVVTDGQNIRVV